VGWDGAGVRGEGMDWVGGASGRCGKERKNRMEEGEGVGAGLGTKREGRGGRGSRYSARMEQKQGHGWEQDSWSGTGWEV
jgi:hypothetical protein